MLPELGKELNSKYQDVRAAAAKALGDLKDASAVPTLITVLADAEPSVRAAAATALGELKNVSAVPALMEVLKDSFRPVGDAAADALEMIGDPSASSALSAYREMRAKERRAYIDSLPSASDETSSSGEDYGSDNGIQISDPRWHGFLPLPLALGLAGNNAPDWFNRVTAFFESHPVATIAFVGIGAVVVFFQFKKDTRKQSSKIPAANRPENIARQQKIARAMGVLQSSSYEDGERIMAVNFLSGLKATEVVGELMKMLEDETLDVSIRQSIVMALGQIGDKRAVPSLEKALGDARVNFYAGWALKMINGESRSEVRVAADEKQFQKAMADLQTKWWDFALGAAAGDRIYNASQTLKEIGDARAVPALIDVLNKNRNNDARRGAAIALGKFKDASAVPALLAAMTNGDGLLWAASVFSLGEIGDAQAVPALVEAFKVKSSNHQIEIIEALGKIGGPDALAALEDARDNDKNTNVQKAAAYALDHGTAGRSEVRSVGGFFHAAWNFVGEQIWVAQIPWLDALPVIATVLGIGAIIAFYVRHQYFRFPSFQEDWASAKESAWEKFYGVMKVLWFPFWGSAVVAFWISVCSILILPIVLIGNMSKQDWLSLVPILVLAANFAAISAVIAAGIYGTALIRTLKQYLSGPNHKWSQDQLIAALNNRRAQQILKESNKAWVAPALLEVVRGTNNSIRAAAVSVLMERNDASVVPALNEVFMAHSDVNARAQAARALLYYKDPRSAEAAIVVLKNPIEIHSLWEAAASILIACNGAAVVPALNEILMTHADANARAQVARALLYYKDPRSAEAAIAALKDPDETVRDYAAEIFVLLKLGTDPKRSSQAMTAVPLLLGDLVNKNVSVRSRAASALNEMGWKPANNTESIQLFTALQRWDDAAKFGAEAVPYLLGYFNVSESSIARVLLHLNDPRLASLERYLKWVSASSYGVTHNRLMETDIDTIRSNFLKGYDTEATYVETPEITHEESRNDDQYYPTYDTVVDSYADLKVTIGGAKAVATSAAVSNEAETSDVKVSESAEVKTEEVTAPVTPQKAETKPVVRELPEPYIPDMLSWDFKTPAIDASYDGMNLISTRAAMTAMTARNWLWRFFSGKDKQSYRHQVTERIGAVRSRIAAVVLMLSENKIISNENPLVSISLAGSYPWVSNPNDLDLIVIVEGERSLERITSDKLTAGSRPVIPGLATSLEVVGLETLKRAAQGADFKGATVLRRKLIMYSGAIPLTGMDLFEGQKIPFENYAVMRDDLAINAERAAWPEIQGDEKKIAVKKEWRKTEMEALAQWLEERSEEVLTGVNVSVSEALLRKEEAYRGEVSGLVQANETAHQAEIAQLLQKKDAAHKEEIDRLIREKNAAYQNEKTRLLEEQDIAHQAEVTRLVQEKKAAYREEVFNLVLSRVPAYLTKLRTALEELKPLVSKAALTPEEVAAAISEKKQKYSLSEEGVRVLQSVFEDSEAPAARSEARSEKMMTIYGSERVSPRSVLAVINALKKDLVVENMENSRDRMNRSVPGYQMVRLSRLTALRFNYASNSQTSQTYLLWLDLEAALQKQFPGWGIVAWINHKTDISRGALPGYYLGWSDDGRGAAATQERSELILKAAQAWLDRKAAEAQQILDPNREARVVSSRVRDLAGDKTVLEAAIIYLAAYKRADSFNGRQILSSEKQARDEASVALGAAREAMAEAILRRIGTRELDKIIGSTDFSEHTDALRRSLVMPLFDERTTWQGWQDRPKTLLSYQEEKELAYAISLERFISIRSEIRAEQGLSRRRFISMMPGLAGVFSLGFLLGCGEQGQNKKAAPEAAAPVQPKTVATVPSIPVFYPAAWQGKAFVAADYKKPMVCPALPGLELEATEANASTSANGAIMGPSFAFWLNNNSGNDLGVKKVTVYALDDKGVPMKGFEMVPPRGRETIALGAGASHVIPLWPKSDNAIPDQLAVMIEANGHADAVYLVAGLKDMMRQKWDIRERWLKGTKLSGVSRIIHPRYYEMSGMGKIDAGFGSEIFIGPAGMENVIFDLGHGESWQESRSMDEKNPEVYYIINPVKAAALKNVTIVSSARSEVRTAADEKAFHKAMSDLQPKWWDFLFGAAAGDRVYAAAMTLGEMNDLEAVPYLIDVLNNNRNNDARRGAAIALGKLKDRRAVPALLKAMTNGDGLLWSACVFSLGEIGDPQAVPDLVKAFKLKSSNHQIEILEALGKIGSPDALAALEDARDHDKNTNVQKAATFALDRAAAGPSETRLQQASDGQVRTEIKQSGISRRTFVKKAFLATAAAGLFGFASCRKEEFEPVFVVEGAPYDQAAITQLPGEPLVYYAIRSISNTNFKAMTDASGNPPTISWNSEGVHIGQSVTLALNGTPGKVMKVEFQKASGIEGDYSGAKKIFSVKLAAGKQNYTFDLSDFMAPMLQISFISEEGTVFTVETKGLGTKYGYSLEPMYGSASDDIVTFPGEIGVYSADFITRDSDGGGWTPIQF